MITLIQKNDIKTPIYLKLPGQKWQFSQICMIYIDNTKDFLLCINKSASIVTITIEEGMLRG